MILTYHTLTPILFPSPGLAMRTDLYPLRYMSDRSGNLIAAATAHSAAIWGPGIASVQICERRIVVGVDKAYAVSEDEVRIDSRFMLA